VVQAESLGTGEQLTSTPTPTSYNLITLPSNSAIIDGISQRRWSSFVGRTREHSCSDMSRAEKLLSVLYNDQIGAGLVNEESTEDFAVLPRWLRLLGHVTLMVLISCRDLSFMLERFRVRLCGCLKRVGGRVSTRRHLSTATRAGSKAACKLTIQQRFATTPDHLQGCIKMHMHPTLWIGGRWS
jgi:hypothetical protein